MRPIVLGPNQFHRFYRGGRAISHLRGIPSRSDHMPEDWIGSVTTTFGFEEQGQTVLEEGLTLRAAIEREPELFLSPEHVARFGADPALLVKLLDAGERLPVHFHPDRDFARAHLGSKYGKTEAWYIVSAGADAWVGVGFRRDVDARTVAGWVEEQDSQAMLEALNRVPVTAGDALFVPAGTAHAIGEGILIVELQEPTDFSVLLEWKGFEIDGAAQGHLGLGFDLALRGLHRSALGRDRLRRLAAGRDRGGRRSAEVLFPPEADPFFRAERLRPADPFAWSAGFCILIALEGRGRLETSEGGELDVHRGTTVLVPFASGDCLLSGQVDALRCMPPDPGAA